MQRDSATMTESERFCEIAEILARGVQRLFANEIKARRQPRNSVDPLDAIAVGEAACRLKAQNPKSTRSTT
jgi:hypothetical protein